VTRLRFVHWQDEDFHVGYFEDYTDCLTQGKTLDELRENLADLYEDITSHAIPFIKKVDELVLS